MPRCWRRRPCCTTGPGSPSASPAWKRSSNEHADAVLPVTRRDPARGRGAPAARRCFWASTAWRPCARWRARMWKRMDTLVVPTTPTIYRQDEIAAEPRVLNGRARPLRQLRQSAGDGRGGGAQRLSPRRPAHRDHVPGRHGAATRACWPWPVPTTARWAGPWGPPAATRPRRPRRQAGRPPPRPDLVRLAVVGAHLSGQPLNHELTDRGARLVRTTRTAPIYRLFALPGTTPPKPGLLRVAADAGDGRRRGGDRGRGLGSAACGVRRLFRRRGGPAVHGHAGAGGR